MSYAPTLATASNDPRLGFESLVRCEGNAFAVDYAKRLTENSLQKVISPVLVIGESGLGKTHLLSAIANTCDDSLMVDAVDLTSEFDAATRSGQQAAFREWLLSPALLLIDDIQLCEGEPYFQKELFVILNKIAVDGRTAIISSDRKPAALHGINDALLSRLKTGMYLELQMCDRDTRLKILEQSGLSGLLTFEVMSRLADQVSTNIRELKSAAHQLDEIRQTTGHPVSPAVVDEVISIYGLPETPSENALKSEAASADSPRKICSIPASFFEDMLKSANTPPEQTLAIQIILQEWLKRLRRDVDKDNAREIAEIKVAIGLLRNGRMSEAMQLVERLGPGV